MSELPAHVGIIMDGNGRWARKRGLMRVAGHEAGVDSVRCVTEECARLKLEQLTLYAFSSENWKRPKHEVLTLMHQLERFLSGERDTIMRNGVRLTAIGDEERLPTSVRRALNVTRSMSAENTGMNLCLALSYGGRQEILHATRAIARKVAAGELLPDKLTEESIRAHLYQPDMPELDLVIRTGGELRISNFLLWQISYSELYVTDTLWPAFREPDLHAAFQAYASRERRFGGLVDRIGPVEPRHKKSS
jgi:undecaprenyl diphosphate synthase